MDGRGLSDAMAMGTLVLCLLAAVVGWATIEGLISLVKWIINHVRVV
jgi:hypothetical protein